MKKQEFLNILQKSLEDNLGQSNIKNHINYYNHYIDDEIKKGRKEKEIIDELGDPRLIAKTIIDTEDMRGSQGYTTYEESADQNREKARGFRMNYGDDNGFDIRYRGFKLNNWFGKFLLMLIVVLVLIVVLAVLSGVIVILATFAAPIMVIVLMIALIRKFK